MFEVASAWKTAFPGPHVGALVMWKDSNPAHHVELQKQKAQLEDQLRSQFAGQDRAAIANHPSLKICSEYYRRIKKSYHVQQRWDGDYFECYLRS